MIRNNIILCLTIAYVRYFVSVRIPLERHRTVHVENENFEFRVRVHYGLMLRLNNRKKKKNVIFAINNDDETCAI